MVDAPPSAEGGFIVLPAEQWTCAECRALLVADDLPALRRRVVGVWRAGFATGTAQDDLDAEVLGRDFDYAAPLFASHRLGAPTFHEREAG